MSISSPRRLSRTRTAPAALLDTLEVRTLLSGVVAQAAGGLLPGQTTSDGNGGVYAIDVNNTFDHATLDAQGNYSLVNTTVTGTNPGISFTALAYSASDNTLWAAGSDNLIYHFDTAGNTTVAAFDPASKSAQFAANSEFIASMTVSSDGTLWFTTSGAAASSSGSNDYTGTSEIGRLNLQEGTFSLTALPDGTNVSALATAADGTVWATTSSIFESFSGGVFTATSGLLQASWDGSQINLSSFNVADSANVFSSPVVIQNADGIPADYSVYYTSSVAVYGQASGVVVDGVTWGFGSIAYPDVAGQVDQFSVTAGQADVFQASLPGGGTQTQLNLLNTTIPAGDHSSLIPAQLTVDSNGVLWFSEIDQQDLADMNAGGPIQNPVVNALDSLDTNTGDFARIVIGADTPYYTVASGATVWVSVFPAAGVFDNGDSVQLDTVDTADASNITSIGVGFDATATQAYTGAISMFGSADAGDFAYSIDYGNGTSFSGTITNDGSGSYTVPGNVTYAAAGNYDLTLTITSASGDTVIVHGVAAVAPVTTTIPLVAQGIVPAIAGQKDVALAPNVSGQPTLVVAQFSGAPASYTATIDWGDNTSTTGTIVATGANEYVVELAAGQTKTYNALGTFTITVTISDGTQSAVATSSANIVAVPVVASQNLVLKPIFGPIALGTVATFTADPLATASWFKTTIHWGDGSTSTGLVVRTASGAFQVIGLHIYKKKGTYAVTTNITDTVDNETALATASITITR